MRRHKNRYRNSLGLPGLAKWIVVILLMGGIGLSYVYMKNQFVAKSDRKRGIEEEITRLEAEIETLDLRIARRMDRAGVDRMLQTIGSELRRIDPRKVEHLERQAHPPVSEVASVPLLVPVAGMPRGN